MIFCLFAHVIRGPISPPKRQALPCGEGAGEGGILPSSADMGRGRAAREAAERATARVGGKRARRVRGRAPAQRGGVQGGVVETVTSAKPTRGQLLAGGKGKRQRKDCGGKRS